MVSIDPVVNACGKTLVTYHSKVAGYDSTTRINSFTDTTSDIYVLKGAFNRKEIANSGGLIEQDDIKIIIKPSDLSSITPGEQDTVTIGSIEYEIIRYKKIDIGSTVIAWVFQLR